MMGTTNREMDKYGNFGERQMQRKILAQLCGRDSSGADPLKDFLRT